MERRKRFRQIGVFEVCNTLLMLAVCFLTLYPMWFVFINSLNAPQQASLGTVNWFPKELSLASYSVVFNDKTMMNGFYITTLRTVIGTATHVLFTAIIAYGMSKSNLIGRKLYLKIALVTMLFSGGLIPTFILMTKLGLYDNFWIFIIPSMYTFFNMVIFMSFFRTIPDSLEESAKVDGASDYGVLFRIVLPNSMAVIATISLFQPFIIGMIITRGSSTSVRRNYCHCRPCCTKSLRRTLCPSCSSKLWRNSAQDFPATLLNLHP